MGWGISGARRLMAVALMLGLAACANAESVRQKGLDTGTVRTFDADYRATQQAVVDGLALLRLHATAEEDVPEGHIFMVGRPPHSMFWSYGEVGRILVEHSDAAPTTVRVVYEKRFLLAYAGGSESHFARNLFAKMDQALKTGPAIPGRAS